MDKLPKQTLIELINEHGHSLCDDPKRLRAFLRDLCGPYPREINVLVNALREGVATDLLASAEETPPKYLLDQLTKRLQENLAINEQAARWAVSSWAIALGKQVPEPDRDKTFPDTDRVPHLTFTIKDTPKKLPLIESDINIGRHSSNKISLSDDHKVSRQHARLSRSGNTFVVSDLQSANGTFVNEKRLDAGEVVRLKNGDRIRVGDTVFNFDGLPVVEPEPLPAPRPFITGKWLIGAGIVVAVLICAVAVWGLSGLFISVTVTPPPPTVVVKATSTPASTPTRTPTTTPSKSPTPGPHPSDTPTTRSQATDVLLTLTPTPKPSSTPRPTPTPTPAKASISGEVVVDGSARLNVRAGPSVGYSIVSRLDNDDEVEILRQTPTGEWLEIETPEGVTGWVAGQFIEILGNAADIEVASDLPPTPVLTGQLQPLDLAASSISGNLTPGEEEWFTFFEDGSETVFYFMFEPNVNFNSNDVQFFLHDQNQIPVWPPSDPDLLKNVGAGSKFASDRDGDLNTGELIWRGGPLQRDVRYYLRFVNRNPTGIKYCLTPREEFVWTCP